MDGRRFDALTRGIAISGNRRSLLKGLLGLGGVVAVGSQADDAEAARRSGRHPRPPRCPGQQTWDGNACVCPSGLSQCGPDCCGEGGECCDNACCYGTCFGEELCCETPREYCATTGECCSEGSSCCDGYGCLDFGQCCAAEDCPPQNCQAPECTTEHTCAYHDDCNFGTGCCGDGVTCLPDGACCTPSCEGKTCGEDDGCGGACPCPDGKSCINGGCFDACDQLGACGSCTECVCDLTGSGHGQRVCINTVTSVTTCQTNGDCPSGTICSRLASTDIDEPWLCAYPCCAGSA